MDTTFIYICMFIATFFLIVGVAIMYYMGYVPASQEATRLRNELSFFPKGFEAYHKATIDALNARDIDTGTAAVIKTFVFEGERLSESLAAEQEAHLKTHDGYQEVIANMGTELEMIRTVNDTLKLESKALQDKLESIQFDLEMLEQNAKTAPEPIQANQVAPTPAFDAKEFRDAAESILISIGVPKSNYEIGVYNGVASAVNVVINDEAFALLSPVLEASKVAYVMPKRDEKGRFLKATV